MKKISALMAALLMLCGIANATQKSPIDPYSLPKAAQQLVERHWPSTIVDKAWRDGKEFEALLTDGTLIEFNAKGEWKECRCMDGLPVTIVPTYITRYIVARYPRMLIIHLEKMKGGYEVQLNNGLEIQFDLRGNVTKVDD